jgi:hypothetical protein
MLVLFLSLFLSLSLFLFLARVQTRAENLTPLCRRLSRILILMVV